MKLIFKFLANLNNRALFVITIVSFIVGFITNLYCPTSLFVIKFFLLLTIFNILILTLKHLDKFVIKDFLRASQDPILSAEKLKLKNGILSNYNIVISLFVSLFFIIVSIYLKFINFDITGYFSLVLLFITVFVSIIGQLSYIQIIHFFYRLNKSEEIEKYSKFNPAYSNWLIDITKSSATYQNAFFISGTLYLFLFSIHAPNETIRLFSFKEPYNSHDIVLLAAWVVIILAVVIGFPLTTYLKSRMIRSIITNLKSKVLSIMKMWLIGSKSAKNWTTLM
jgi:hypothetical protein